MVRVKSVSLRAAADHPCVAPDSCSYRNGGRDGYDVAGESGRELDFPLFGTANFTPPKFSIESETFPIYLFGTARYINSV